MEIVQVLEQDGRYVNTHPKGEPQLGRRGLYGGVGGGSQLPGYELALLWVLSCADGERTLLETAERAAMSFTVIRQAADALLNHELLRPADTKVPEAAP